MIERFYKAPWTLARLHAGPLGPHVDAFTVVLLEYGYSRATIRCQLRLVGDLSQWLAKRRFGLEALDESTVVQAVRDSPRSEEFLGNHQAVFATLLMYLREQDLIAPAVSPKADESAIGRALFDYRQYLEQERGLSWSTVTNYLAQIQAFLGDRFGTGPLVWSALTPGDIAAFLVRYAQHRSHERVRLMVTSLRSLFRFLRWSGDLPTHLATAVFPVAEWRLSSVPQALESRQVQRLLASCDRETLVGQRDYAILLILSRLGLRAGEVMSMRLEDIDWRAGELTVRGKGAQHDRLPIPRDVGEALAAYLQQRHPKTSTRRVFVRVRAPYRGFAKASSVSVIVHRALERAGIDSVHRGAHLLRHSLACEMLRQDATMAEIGQILRHRSPLSTEIYAKVDQSALRQLAPPWPGGTW